MLEENSSFFLKKVFGKNQRVSGLRTNPLRKDFMRLERGF